MSSLATTPMPFKIGLELQELNNVCPWATANYTFQRKPIFELSDKETSRKLWHVVIDGQDLEFVISPFARDEKSLLIKAVKTVQIACQALKERRYNSEDLRNALHTQQVTNLIGKANFEKRLARTLRESQLAAAEESFHIWNQWLISSGKYPIISDVILEEIWNSDIGPTTLESVFKIAKMGNTSTPTFVWWIENVERVVSNELYLLMRHSFFEQVQEQKINLPSQIGFQPQVTIQYPLEFTVPLLFGLYGYNEKTKEIKALLHSLPYFGGRQEPEIEDIRTKSFSKLGGLMFLHALTLSGIVPEDTTDSRRLEKIQERYNSGRGQVDAKGLLYFMSRRPFSEMWKEIPDHQGINLLEEYALSMRENSFFARKFFSMRADSVEGRLFVYPDYAEEIYSDGTRVNLSHITEAFDASFLTDNRHIVEHLLKQGIVSITMIRNLCLNALCLDGKKIRPNHIFETFPVDSVVSIVHPTSRFVFNYETTTIEERPSSYDLLSPPLFLDEDDSMGLLKESEKYDTETYGEAIVEVRMAKNMIFKPESFLTIVDDLVKDMDKLFLYLYSINVENFLTNDQVSKVKELAIERKK